MRLKTYILLILTSCTPIYQPQIDPTSLPTSVESMKITPFSYEQPQQDKYSPEWEWKFQQADIVIISLDYRTLSIEDVYISHQEPCNQTVAMGKEQELLSDAITYFDAVKIGYGRRQVKTVEGKQWEPIVSLKNVGELAVVESPAGDFGGFGIFYKCNGEILYAGSTIWDGQGEQRYPTSALRSEAIEHTLAHPPQPQQISVVIGQDVTGFVDEESGIIANHESGLIAWNHAKDLNILEGFVFAPYSVLVYLYPRSMGVFDPNYADWIIVVHRGPTE